MPQEDQGNLGKDMHIPRERQRHEENTEACGIGPPCRAFEIHQRERADVLCHPRADRPRQESPAAVKGAGRALGNQAHREDEPQRREGHAVAQHVSGRTPHAHRPRVNALAPSQRHARKDEKQQQVHQEVEHGLMFQPRGEIFEKDVSLQRHIPESEVSDGLDPPHGDQQEPAESQTHVHVAQQRIDLEDAAVQQRFADPLPHGRQRAARRQSEQNPFLVGAGQSAEPRTPLPEQYDEHHGRADHERYAEWCEKSHRQKSPSLRLISMTTPRVLIPRGHTSRHLPQSMHLFISS